MKPLSISPREPLHKNKICEIFRATADFGRFSREYFIIKPGSRVGVLMYRGDSVLLVKQYRFVINDYSWEIPSGGIEAGETAEQAAIRECREESGYECRNVEPLYDYFINPDIIECWQCIFKSGDFSLAGSFDKDEIDGTRWITRSECMDMISSREISDIYTITALCAFFHGWKRPERPLR
jgi:ADP-ribose pyrophosphatase